MPVLVSDTRTFAEIPSELSSSMSMSTSAPSFSSSIRTPEYLFVAALFEPPIPIGVLSQSFAIFYVPNFKKADALSFFMSSC